MWRNAAQILATNLIRPIKWKYQMAAFPQTEVA
jgi:hypothetical protein